MGSYADLTIGGFLVLSTRSFAYPEAATVFDESDRFYTEPKDDEHIALFGYSAAASVIRDRLDVMGFSLSASREEFGRSAAERRAEIAESEWDIPAEERENDVLSYLSFDGWLVAFATLRTNDIQSWNRGPQHAAVLAADPDLFSYMLADDAAHLYGFPTADFRFFLRAALETCNSLDIVEYDLAEVLNAGYYAADTRVADDARQHLLADFPVNAPIIVLTEGSTDSIVLRTSLEILQPHLSTYYSFLDFASASVRGGATALVEVVKAFIGARIANRVIAVFDNDSAAEDAIRALRNISIPHNIRILKLPPILLGSNYPTIGPSGDTTDDINGKAGSLELYFGRDVLVRPDGTLTPVQWRGYVEGVKRYQGELMDKRDLLTRFNEKAQAARHDARMIDEQDWSDMRLVLEALRSAFSHPQLRPN